MIMNSSTIGGQGLNQPNSDQAAAGLIVQSYCNTILQQPKVDFSSLSGNANWTKLKALQDSINGHLTLAQQHASDYLNGTQKKIITNITNIDNYFTLQHAMASIPADTSVSTWKSAIQAVINQCGGYQANANQIQSELSKFAQDLSNDSAGFAADINNLNELVDGDNGLLHSLSDQVSDIKSKIDGCIAGIAVSGLLIVGGVFMAVVGAVADFVTAGTSTPLVAGGIAIAAAGVGGMTASCIIMSKLSGELGDLYTQQSQLTNEVKLATNVSSIYDSLKTQCNSAATAATSMSNAWGLLAGDLSSIQSDLGNTLTVPVLYSTWVAAAQDVAKNGVQQDIKAIKTQMTGVQNIVLPPGTTVQQYYANLAKPAA